MAIEATMLPPYAKNAAVVFPICAYFMAMSRYANAIVCIRNIGKEHEVSHCGNLNVVITPQVKSMRNGNDNLPMDASNCQA